MHVRTLTLTLTIAGLLGCSGLLGPETAPQPPSAPSPAPTREAAPPESALPAPAFGPAPGWLAYAARRPGEPAERPFTPRHPTSAAVALSPEGWDAVAADTPVQLVAIEGNVEARFGGVATHPHGCDGVPTAMASFDAPRTLAEQLVWVLPADAGGARAVPIVQSQSDATKSTWKVGPLEVVVRADGEHAGTFAVFHGDTPLHERRWEQPPVEDLTLSVNAPSPGVPLPTAAFQVDDESLVVVVVTPSLEGFNADVLLWRQTLVPAGTAYVYLCAY